MGNDARGTSGLQGDCGQSAIEGDRIVSVDLSNGPAEAAPLVGKRLQADSVMGRNDPSRTVVINNDDQVVKTMMPGKQGRLPGGSFVAFVITEQSEDAVSGIPPHGSVRHPGRYGQPLSERPGQLDARDGIRCMAAESGAVLIVACELLDRKKPALGQRRVQTGAGVSLMEYETVAPRPARVFGIYAEDGAVERRQNVGAGKDGTDVRTAARGAPADLALRRRHRRPDGSAYGCRPVGSTYFSGAIRMPVGVRTGGPSRYWREISASGVMKPRG